MVLAFVIFLSFQSYGEAKTQAGVEAVTITELHRNASLFDDATQAELQGGLICYARTVIEDKWPLMRERRSSPRVTQWVADVSSAVDGAEVSGVQEAAGYAQWLDQGAERRDARRGRLAEADPFVPEPLWYGLLLGALLVAGCACLFIANRRDRLLGQAVLIGAITSAAGCATLDGVRRVMNGDMCQRVETRFVQRIAARREARGDGRLSGVGVPNQDRVRHRCGRRPLRRRPCTEVPVVESSIAARPTA